MNRWKFLIEWTWRHLEKLLRAIGERSEYEPWPCRYVWGCVICFHYWAFMLFVPLIVVIVLMFWFWYGTPPFWLMD